MADTSKSIQPFKRSQYLIDAPAQFRLILPLLGVLAGVAVAYSLAVHLLPGGAALETMTADETRRLFLRANVVYFAIATLGVAGVAVVITHRVIGPARVIERAIRGLRNSDYDQRLALRPSDSLQSLAAAVMELRDDLQHRADHRRAIGRELASLLEANDLHAMRQLLTELDKPESPP